MQNLNGDPLPWLLDPENPSVRYWILIDILDRPADAPEVQEARAALTLLYMLGVPPRAAFAFLVEDMSADDALDCGRYQHQDCLWGAIAALNGFTV